MLQAVVPKLLVARDPVPHLAESFALLLPRLCFLRALAGRVPDGGTGDGVPATVEVAAGRSRVGVELEGLPEVADGLVQPAPVTQSRAEVDVGRGRPFRIEPDGFQVVAGGLVLP